MPIRSSTTNNRENGVDITFLQHSLKFTVTEVEHKHANIFPVNIQIINHLSCCGPCGELFVLLDETALTKIGKEFDLNLHVKNLQ